MLRVDVGVREGRDDVLPHKVLVGGNKIVVSYSGSTVMSVTMYSKVNIHQHSTIFLT